ncbi:hypothetical protein LDENG_00231340 [Lucifuga dentata]|nr:hypothetical protein LDENG_00231340 [Lucifuga dentata]
MRVQLRAHHTHISLNARHFLHTAQPYSCRLSRVHEYSLPPPPAHTYQETTKQQASQTRHSSLPHSCYPTPFRHVALQFWPGAAFLPRLEQRQDAYVKPKSSPTAFPSTETRIHT